MPILEIMEDTKSKMTPAEKQKAYRERKKMMDPDYAKKESERKKVYRAKNLENMSPRALEDFRIKERKRQKTIYQKKKTEALNQNVENQKTGFKSPQALGKAIKRVKKALPMSPTKRRQVLSCLLPQSDIKNKPINGKRNRRSLSVEDEVLVKDFFESDDASWQAPGQKDRIII